MADNKQKTPDGKEEKKEPRKGLLPRTGNAILNPWQTTKKAGRWTKETFWTGKQRNPAEEAAQHDAEKINEMLGESKGEEGEAGKPRISATAADVETSSEDTFKLFNAWFNDSIINGAPKMPDGVQEPIWNIFEDKYLRDAIAEPPKDRYDEQPTLISEERGNTDLKYQESMKKARKELAEKLEQKNVMKLHSDEVDIILRTMLYLTETVRDEEGRAVEQYKYRDKFYEIILDGAKMVEPNEEAKVIGHVLNYLAKKQTTGTTQPEKAVGALADENVAHQFFMKYSYPAREELAKDFYDALKPMPEEKREKYRAVLLQEIRRTPEELDAFKNYFERLERGEDSGNDPVIAKNFKKEHNPVLAKVVDIIAKELIVEPDEHVSETKLKDIERTKNTLKDRLEKDETVKKSIDPGTITEIGALLDIAYEVAKDQKEMNNFEYGLAKNLPDKKDAIDAAAYKLDRMHKKIEDDRKAFIKLKNELVLRSFPVLKIAYARIKKNLYDVEGPANIKMNQYMTAPIYYSGGRKDVYGKLETGEEGLTIRFLKWLFKRNFIAKKIIWPLLKLEVLKWEKVDGEKEKKPGSKFDKAISFIRTDWAEKARLKVKNETLRTALWYATFPLSTVQATMVLGLAVPYYLVGLPIVKSWEWTAKKWKMPEQIVEEELTLEHTRDGKPRKKIMKQVALNSVKATLSAGITAAYLIGIPYNFNYVQKGFGYVGRGIATVWNNMTGGRIAFYDSMRDKKMKEMKAGMQNEIKRAKTAKKKENFVSKYFRYELEENLKSRGHYVSAYYSESPERWLARKYYGNKDAERISDKDIEVLAKITYGEATGTEEQKKWLGEYTAKVEIGKKYSLPVVSFTKDETSGAYSMGINTPAAHGKKKQELDRQLAWLEKHPAVVEFLEEAHSLSNVETVTNEDFNIKADSAEKNQWHNAGWHGPETKVLPKINNKGETMKKDGKPIMEERHVYHRKGYMGEKKDGIKLNPHKTEELIAVLMKKKEPMAYIKENMLELIDSDYFIAADVARCMGSYGVNLENAKFLMSNPNVMAWLQPMLDEGHAVYYVKRDRANDMVELVKRQSGVRGITRTVELKPDTVAMVIENAEKKGILEDRTSVFGAYGIKLVLKEQLGEHYPNKDNVLYIIQNEVETYARRNNYVIKAGEEKKLAWAVMWEIGTRNADAWKKMLTKLDSKTTYEDILRDSYPTRAFMPHGADVGALKNVREELMSKVLTHAVKKGMVSETVPEYVPSMSIRELMLDYMAVGGYNIVEGRADDFVKKTRQHLETGGDVEDLKQPYGVAVPQLAMYGIVWIPTDEASSAAEGVPSMTNIMPQTAYRSSNLKTKLVDGYLPNNNLFDGMVADYGELAVTEEAKKLVEEEIDVYYKVLILEPETGEKELDEKNKKLIVVKNDLLKKGIRILDEKTKNEDLAKSVEEQEYANAEVDDPVLDPKGGGEKLANWVMTHKKMQEKFPPKDTEEAGRKKAKEEKPAEDTGQPKKKKAKKKKPADSKAPEITF